MNCKKPAQIFFATMTVLTVMMALVVPAPVYAGGPGPGEPPPPHTPSNDMGGPGIGPDTNVPPPPSSKTTAAPQVTRTKVISRADIFVLDAIGKVVPLSSIGTTAALEARFCTVDILGGTETCNPTVATLTAAMNQAKGYIYNQTVPEGMLIKLGKGNFGEGINLDLLGFFISTSDIQKPYGVAFSGQSTAAKPRKTIVDYVDISNSYPTLNYVNINGLAVDQDIYLYNIQTHPFGTSTVLPAHIDLTNLVIDEGLFITDSSGKLTLKNVTLAPVGGGEVNAQPFIGSITILNHNGDVSLDHVNANQQSLYGAEISTSTGLAPEPDQPAGAADGPAADVSIQNSKFNENGGFGLMVFAAGDISLNNVNANSNGQWGASLNPLPFSPTSNVTIENSKFNENSEAGIMAWAWGDITLNKVIADNNGIDENDCVYPPYYGCPSNLLNTALLRLPLDSADVVDGVGGNVISVTNSEFNNNGGGATDSTSGATAQFYDLGIGLLAYTNGAVDLQGVTANGNAENGVELGSYDSVLGADVTVKNSTFNDNGLDSLLVFTAGNILLDKVKANDGFEDGAELNVFGQPGDGETTYPLVEVYNSTFNDNGWDWESDGLDINILDPVLGSADITTPAASGDGIMAGIIIKNVIANLNGGSDGNAGISIFLGGATLPVEMTNIIANHNYQSDGINIYYGQGEVTLTNIVANKNTAGDYSGGDGIGIYGYYGTITLDHVTTLNNDGDGIYISDYGEGGSAGALDVTGGGPSVNIICAITRDNAYHGLHIEASETTPIELTSITSTGNDEGDFFSHSPTINPPVDCKWSAPSSGGKGGVEGEPVAFPIQIIRVYEPDPNKGSGILSHLFSTVFLYLQKQPDNQPDKELARVSLPVGVAPSGSTATFVGLSENTLPAPLPEGDTFQGPAFNMIFTSPDGSNITGLAGNFMVQFDLPVGFTTPAGKKLAILWYDEVAKEWVKLTTYTGANFAYAYASKPGKFVLVLEPA